MPAWRRCLSTSALAISQQQKAKPVALRCKQIFEASKTSSAGGGSSLDNREIRVRGFIRSVRKQKRFAFAEISDGSTFQSLQAILTPEQASPLTTGAAVEISGLWKPCPPGKEQTHELQATEVSVVGEADAKTYPIQKKYHTADFLRQIPHLRLRTPFNSLLSRFRSECIFQAANVFHSRSGAHFVQVQPPLITSSDCEGAGEVFKVTPQEASSDGSGHEEFFRSPKYLTVSSQLHLEAYAAELGNVWTLSPTFRAERSDTPRHLSEFYMLEVEMNFTRSLEELTEFVESFIREWTQRMYETSVVQELITAKRTGESEQDSADSGIRQRWLRLMEENKWPQITYTEAIDILQKAASSSVTSFEFPPLWSAGLQLEHEKYLVEAVGNGAPIFITDYPKKVKPFYMAPSMLASTSGQETVACFDLLLPEVCEVVGGSVREHRLPQLIQNMREHGLIKQQRQTTESPSSEAADVQYPYLRPGEDLGPLRWYADLRRWGSAPHGGFGLGFDRFIGYLSGVASIRDVVPFPRHFGRADC
ncbi:hypothetical protein VTO42DRAFT_930 [Malbranchea cinnamomea]